MRHLKVSATVWKLRKLERTLLLFKSIVYCEGRLSDRAAPFCSLCLNSRILPVLPFF